MALVEKLRDCLLVLWGRFGDWNVRFGSKAAEIRCREFRPLSGVKRTKSSNKQTLRPRIAKTVAR